MALKGKHAQLIIDLTLSVAVTVVVSFVGRLIGLPYWLTGVIGIAAAAIVVLFLRDAIFAWYMMYWALRVPESNEPKHKSPTTRVPRALLWFTFVCSALGLMLAERSSPVFWFLIVTGGASFIFNGALLLRSNR